MRLTKRSAIAQTVVLFALGSAAAWGQGPPGPPNPPSLKSVPLPPVNAARYVKDQDALVELGKALFWDMQMGSDGRTACATCHFHAGADHRMQNQTSNTTSAFVPDQTLASSGFPFHQLANPDDNRSIVMSDSSVIAGSQGVFRRTFTDIVPGSAAESGQDAADRPAFSVNGVNVRQVGSRNAPSVINAVFNFRNFWDGRAGNIFSGLTAFGASDKAMNPLVFNNGQLAPELVSVQNASLASQSMAPPLNDAEASYSGRTWQKLGKKMLSLNPLAKQRVAPDDGVLGSLANTAGPGLLPQYSYLSMVQNAFQQAYWGSGQLVDATGSLLAGRQAPAANTSEYTQAEFNFGVFWGLAIQAYEATLVSDNSPYDQFAEGNTQALTSQQQNGQNLFRRKGCANCHSGPEFTAASFGSVSRRGALQGGRNEVRVDTGYFRTGVRPIAEDIGLGGVDGFGAPLSIAVRQLPNAQPAVKGLFMTPGLRNAEFTGPYFP
jgi:cytochrome c peroxidase